MTNQCSHSVLTLGANGWHCATCLRIFLPSGDTGAEQECVRQRLEIERLHLRESQARVILEPLAEHDPAIRQWLKGLLNEPTAKQAYYQTHEPPHCPSCSCGAEKSDGQS